MSFGPHHQENLLSILAFDDTPGGCTVAAQMLPADAWDAYYGKVYKKLASHIESYGRAPREHTYELIQELCAADADSAEAYNGLYRSMVESWGGGLNRDVVYDNAAVFGEHSRMRLGIGEALSHLGKGVTREVNARAKLALKEAQSLSANVMTVGISMHDTEAVARAATEQPDRPFHTGIPELDEVGAGPARKEFTLLAGSYGSGKSFGLTDIGIASNALDRLKVLVIALEMSAEKVVRRIVQRQFGYASKAGVLDYTTFIKGDGGRLIDFGVEQLTVKGLYDEQAYGDIIRLAGHLKKRPEIVVKGFPSGSLTMAELYAYLDFLEGTTGFVPDMIVLDYMQILEINNPANKRAELGQYAIELRGLAQRRNCAMVSALQLNRDGMKDAMARGNNISEDISAAHTADRLIIYNQSEIEKGMGIARLWLDKSRDSEAAFEVLISQKYAAGVYRLDSMRMHSTYDDVLKRISEMKEAA